MYYGDFILLLAIVITATVYGICSVNQLLRRFSFVLSVLCSAIVLLVGFVFSLMSVSPERVYEEPETSVVALVELGTLKDTNYYLVKDGDEYGYYPEKIAYGKLLANTGDEAAPKIAASLCEVEYRDTAPELSIREAMEKRLAVPVRLWCRK